jgi:hypothetical protein
MRNPGMSHEFLIHIDMLFINQFPQCGDFANLFKEVNFILTVAIYGHSSGIISTVLKSLKACLRARVRIAR